MGKGSETRARAKKLAKKRDLPKLAAAPRRAKQGRRRMEEIAKDCHEGKREAMSARCRAFGISDTAENRKMVDAPHMGCQIGMATQHVYGGNRERVDALWKTFAEMTAAHVVYRSRYLGQADTPAAISIMYAREVFEALEMVKADDRTQEEKDRAAVSRWMTWQGHLGNLDGRERAAIIHARMEDAPIWDAGAPTALGVLALAALVKLHCRVSERS